jgi:hypothetical protein
MSKTSIQKQWEDRMKSKNAAENKVVPIAAPKVFASPKQGQDKTKTATENKVVPIAAPKVIAPPTQGQDRTKTATEKKGVPIAAPKVIASPKQGQDRTKTAPEKHVLPNAEELEEKMEDVNNTNRSLTKFNSTFDSLLPNGTSISVAYDNTFKKYRKNPAFTVSFQGSTGAGKSHLISSLLQLNETPTERPVVADIESVVSTTAGVRVYPFDNTAFHPGATHLPFIQIMDLEGRSQIACL